MKPYYEVDRLIIDYRAREWCKLPYPNHPLGCPNYDHRANCPPSAPLVEDYFDLTQPLWLVVVAFDLHGHIERMKARHPDWSDRQAKCVLYWQNRVNKELELNASQFAHHNGLIYTLCPEAMGVQVIKTAKRIGIPIKPRPFDYVYKIALIGNSKQIKCCQEVMELA